jgi:hypothetical protein
MMRHKYTDIDPAVIPHHILYNVQYDHGIEMTVYRIYGKTAENTVCRIHIFEPYQYTIRCSVRVHALFCDVKKLGFCDSQELQNPTFHFML